MVEPEAEARAGLSAIRGPEPHETRVVLADVHGNHSTLRALLAATGAIDSRGQRRPSYWVCQIGDLLHLGHDVHDADMETFSLAWEWIDCLLIGNHELPFLTPIRTRWAGMHEALEPGFMAELARSMEEGRWAAAVAVDGWW